jgi:hypothetical protein
MNTNATCTMITILNLTLLALVVVTSSQQSLFKVERSSAYDKIYSLNSTFQVNCSGEKYTIARTTDIICLTNNELALINNGKSANTTRSSFFVIKVT